MRRTLAVSLVLLAAGCSDVTIGSGNTVYLSVPVAVIDQASNSATGAQETPKPKIVYAGAGIISDSASMFFKSNWMGGGKTYTHSTVKLSNPSEFQLSGKVRVEAWPMTRDFAATISPKAQAFIRLPAVSWGEHILPDSKISVVVTTDPFSDYEALPKIAGDATISVTYSDGPKVELFDSLASASERP